MAQILINPRGAFRREVNPIAPRPKSLDNKVLGLVENSKDNADISKGNLEWFTKNHPTRFAGLATQDKVPLVDDPDEFMVVVSGGMGRHSMVIPTFGGHTRSVTEPITDSRGEPILPEFE